MSSSLSFACQGLGVCREMSRAGLTAPAIALCPWPVSPSAMVSGSDASPEIKLALIMLQPSAHPLALRRPGWAECRVWREATWPRGSWRDAQGVWVRHGERRLPLRPSPSLVFPLLSPEVSETTRWNPLGLLTGPLMVCMSGGMPPSSPVAHLQRPAHAVPANADPTTSSSPPVPGLC